jgi:putative ABC transport system permease protein
VRRLGDRLFVLLLRLYPRGFRREYGADLLAFFRQDRDHPKYGSGALRPVRFWLATLADLSRTAWRQRVARRPAPEPGIQGRTAGRIRERLGVDLRYGWRDLWSSPGVTVSALAILTLGIGTSTAIFSVVDGVALRGLPFDHADRLVNVAETWLPLGGRPGAAARQNYDEWVARQDVFESIGGSANAGQPTTTTAPIENLHVIRVTASLFGVLRVAPAIGRAIQPADERAGAAPVALISDAVWRRRFQSRRDVLGETVALDGASYQVIGVMPAAFGWPIGSVAASRADLWVPYVPTSRDTVRGSGRTYNLTVVARLAPGVTLERAGVRMQQIRDALAAEYPRWFVDHGIAVRRLQDSIVGAEVRSWMLLLLGAVAVVLLVACLNVANLLLARAVARGRELAVRAALGASPWDLGRGLLVESLMLSLVGTALGVLLSFWGVRILRATLPEELPRLSAIAVDLRVLATAAAAAIVCGVFFGTLPALQLARPDVSATLRHGNRSHTGGALGDRIRIALVTAEVALAVVLLAGSGLFIASFLRVMSVDLGLNPDHVVSIGVYPSRVPAITDRRVRLAAAQSVVMAALDAARRVPGVVAASVLSSGLPLSGSSMSVPVQLPGRREPPFKDNDEAYVHGVTAEYLDVMRCTLVRGRWIADTDRAGAPPVVVLSEEAVRRYFGGRDPLGETIVLNEAPMTVIGIVRGVRFKGPEADVRPEAYVPFPQSDQPGADIAFRTGPDPALVAAAVQAAIRSAAAGGFVAPAETIDGHFAALVARRKFNMIVLALFGVMAIAIASVGIYGLMAFLVAQRTREIGVRIALGALPGGIVQMVLGRATVLMLGGLALGFAGAAVLEGAVRTFLFEARPHDPLVYLTVALVLVVTGLAAAFGPARRAARVDPLIALRSE